MAGIASDRFVFEGFLPNKSAARIARLRELAHEGRTLLFYESSHRIRECLADMEQAFGADRRAVLARELTKKFETVLDGTLAGLCAMLDADENQQRGEFVLIAEGAPQADADAALALGRKAFTLLREHLPPAQAAKLAAEISGAPRRALYQ